MRKACRASDAWREKMSCKRRLAGENGTEAYQAPLRLRREKLALQFHTKLQSWPSNPAFECTINQKYQLLFTRKESAIPTFGKKNAISIGG